MLYMLYLPLRWYNIYPHVHFTYYRCGPFVKNSHLSHWFFLSLNIIPFTTISSLMEYGLQSDEKYEVEMLHQVAI